MSQFIYLLNAFEAASQHDTPAEVGYPAKRKALLEYVEKLESARPEAPLIEAERLSKKWLAAHPHAMMVVEHAGAMLRDALHPTAASVPSPQLEKP